MRDQLLEAALKKFRELEKEADDVRGKSEDAVVETQRRLIAQGNLVRRLQKG